MFVYHRRLAPAIFTSRMSIRPIHSTNHLTPVELRLLWEYQGSKSRLPEPISQNPPLLQPVQPQIYRSESSTWAALENGDHQNCLQHGSILKVVSWNMDAFGPGLADRASAALHHLEELFGEAPSNLIVMLQEVTQESLQAILKSSWAQRNFVVTNIVPPSSLYTNVLGESFVMTVPYWMAARYFTLIMISRYLGRVNCFRVPFVTVMGRDALFVDISISASSGSTRSEFLRLCTTHLESLWQGKAYRQGQLAAISTLLKGPLAVETGIIAGLVGGDMNAIDGSEHELHRAIDVGLKDVWEDVPAPPIPVLKPFQKDPTYGRSRGNTWGYQSKNSRNRKRMDKFFYTGLVETVALTEPQDLVGKLGRIGIALKTEVEAWEDETTEWSFVRGKLVQKSSKTYRSHDQARRLGINLDGARTKISTWVSDHFGIATGIRVG